MTTSRSSHAVPLCTETCRESPSMVAGPSSLASSLRGNSSTSESDSREVVFAVKDKLQVTSGEETRKLFGPGSRAKTGDEPAARRLAASSTTLDKLSLSITESGGAVF